MPGSDALSFALGSVPTGGTGVLWVTVHIVGGLGLFLYGMRVMSDALRSVAGDRMRRILRVLTGNIVVAVLVGAAMTAIIQSSSATTVMVVGFVNAGLMNLKQAIGVIMGANIGTTATAWLVAVMGKVQIPYYALPAIGLGFLLNVVGRRQWKHWGMVLLGFGILFLGLSLMKDALGPLGDAPRVRAVIARYAGNPLSAVFIGMLVTMLVQSSSATIAVVQVMACTGLLSFAQALPLVLGDNIGTTITAQIAAIGTTVEAKRAARAHALFKVLGVCIILPFVWGGQYGRLVQAMVPGVLVEGGPSGPGNVAFHIAMGHTIFNVLDTMVFIPLAGPLAALITKLVPGKTGIVDFEPQYLEEHLLDNPPIALEQARREVVRMIQLAAAATRNASEAFFTCDKEHIRLVMRMERAIDNLQNRITQYLIKISQRDMGPVASAQLPVLLHSVNDIERMGDHAVNLTEAAARRVDGGLTFSDAAMQELLQMRTEVEAMFDGIIHALEASDLDAARGVVVREEQLNGMERRFRESHLYRLAAGDCDFYSGLTFVDCVYNYEKIGDHLTNTAQAVLGDFQWGEKVRLKEADGQSGAGAAAEGDAPVP